MTLQRTLHILLIFTILAAVGVTQAQAGLVSESQEMQMGRDAAKQIEAKYKVSTDRKAIAVVQEMGRKMAAVSPRPKLPWQFKVLENKEVNAFSVPGYVYVNRGLLDFAGSDRAQLAGVIGHEIAHTTRKHAVRQYEKQVGLSIGIEVLLKKRDARNIGGFAANLAMLGYSRSDEFDADRNGVRYVYAAGYDPNGMVRFFERLQQKEGKDSGGLTVYFRTHPKTSDRISRVRKEIANIRGQKQSVLPVSDEPKSNGQDFVLLALAGLLSR